MPWGTVSKILLKDYIQYLHTSHKKTDLIIEEKKITKVEDYFDEVILTMHGNNSFFLTANTAFSITLPGTEVKLTVSWVFSHTFLIGGYNAG